MSPVTNFEMLDSITYRIRYRPAPNTLGQVKAKKSGTYHRRDRENR